MKKVSGGVVRKTGMDAVKTGTKAAAVVGGISYGIDAYRRSKDGDTPTDDEILGSIKLGDGEGLDL